MRTTRKVRWYALLFVFAALLATVAMILRHCGPAKPHSVILTWNPPPPRAGYTLAGYNVYRRTAESSSYVRIAERVADPHYDDRFVSLGREYVYVVTSVDSSGRESGFSAPVTAEIPSR